MTVRIDAGQLFLMVALGLGSVSCNEDDAVETSYALSRITPDPVAVVIDGDVGSLVFDATDNPLPDGSIAEFGALVEDGTITLTVESLTSGITAELAAGSRVDGPPAAPGEYQVDISSDRQTATIRFFNSFDDRTINTLTSYLARIAVVDNEWFDAEVFTRSVIVN